MKTKSIIAISLWILMPSCGNRLSSADIFRNESDFTLTIHPKNKNTFDGLVSKIIRSDSKIIDSLKSWLNNHSDVWQSSPASWATPDISLIGNDFRLLIFKDFAVIGFKDKNGNQVQYTRQIGISDFAFLIEGESPLTLAYQKLLMLYFYAGEQLQANQATLHFWVKSI